MAVLRVTTGGEDRGRASKESGAVEAPMSRRRGGVRCRRDARTTKIGHYVFSAGGTPAATIFPPSVIEISIGHCGSGRPARKERIKVFHLKRTAGLVDRDGDPG